MSGTSSPLPGGAEAASGPSRAQLRQLRDGSPSPVSNPLATSRRDLRLAREAERQSRGWLSSLVTAWWFYPLLLLIAICVYFGVKSTEKPAQPPGIQVTTPSPAT